MNYRKREKCKVVVTEFQKFEMSLADYFNVNIRAFQPGKSLLNGSKILLFEYRTSP